MTMKEFILKNSLKLAFWFSDHGMPGIGLKIIHFVRGVVFNLPPAGYPHKWKTTFEGDQIIMRCVYCGKKIGESGPLECVKH